MSKLAVHFDRNMHMSRVLVIAAGLIITCTFAWEDFPVPDKNHQTVAGVALLLVGSALLSRDGYDLQRLWGKVAVDEEEHCSCLGSLGCDRDDTEYQQEQAVVKIDCLCEISELLTEYEEMEESNGYDSSRDKLFFIGTKCGSKELLEEGGGGSDDSGNEGSGDEGSGDEGSGDEGSEDEEGSKSEDASGESVKCKEWENLSFKDETDLFDLSSRVYESDGQQEKERQFLLEKRKRKRKNEVQPRLWRVFCLHSPSDSEAMEEHGAILPGASIFGGNTPNQHSCSVCGMSFSTPNELTDHLKSHCTGTECVVCKKVLSTEGILKTHLRIHSGEKPFLCSFCGRCFTQRSTRKAHERLHTGEKPYQCHYCGRCFTQSTSLRAHLVTHREKQQAGACKAAMP